ncbi:hypothetical protein ACFCVU_28465 [Peribacillus butanolivorans]|uniref:hypothetical protein n=1 Tax=Peribacillus butanolivorans TaxID=421767 RepID=UPI0035E0C703
MADILTTGPMRVPGQITGDPTGGPPDVVAISIKNPTTKSFTIELFGDVCPPNSTTETTFASGPLPIPNNSCFRINFVNVQPDAILRFFAKGDLDEDAEKLELSFVGKRTSDLMHEPTMYFRHDDLIEVEDEDIHQDPPATGNAWVIG